MNRNISLVGGLHLLSIFCGIMTIRVGKTGGVAFVSYQSKKQSRRRKLLINNGLYLLFDPQFDLLASRHAVKVFLGYLHGRTCFYFFKMYFTHLRLFGHWTLFPFFLRLAVNFLRVSQWGQPSAVKQPKL